jgi:hypothetical protein
MFSLGSCGAAQFPVVPEQRSRTISPAPPALREAMTLALRAGCDGHPDRAQKLRELAAEIRGTIAQAPLPPDAAPDEVAARAAVLSALEDAVTELLRR